MEPNIRILMVDDVSRYHTLYEMAITDVMPAKVDFALNGEEALAKLSSLIPYDLLILDLNMPKLGGEETLRRIRLDPNYDNMPVIILTGDADRDTHRRLLDYGADDFIEKGSPPEIFVARLKAQMRHKLTLDKLAKLAVDMDIFAAGVLHDIRNLETNILAVTEITRIYLEKNPLDHKAQILEDFTALEDKANQLGRYASDIISMVRDTHKPINLIPLDIEPIISWVIKLVSAPHKAKKPNLTYDIAGPLKPVIADRHFLQLAFLNIIQNALKYARPEAPPHLEISQVASSDARHVLSPSIITRIRDHGIGIKKEDLRRVFEPFVRGSSRSKQEGSFGLGLSLVQKVITSMSGHVWAELPESGHGVVICIELPLANT